LAGIDAPEMGHFGSKPQPYSSEAKEWLTKFVQGRRVTVHLHRMDQYSRVVATVTFGPRFALIALLMPWWRTNVSLAMVEAGFATVYDSCGAEYGGIKAKLIAAEAKAK